MQYHHDGYKPGNPAISRRITDEQQNQEQVDVLIVGCGSAGLTLAAQLSAFPDITTRIVDQKPGPLEVGQADGIACRSMEMFEAFGFAKQIEKEAYWVSETTFWRHDVDAGKIVRSDRIQDVEDGLSEFPHTILNQARVHDYYLETMQNGPHRLEPGYNRKLVDVIEHSDAQYPIECRFSLAGANAQQQDELVRCRYLVGCDGARSTVRKHLGLELEGTSARQLWGVMDVLAVTDFPDIRMKCAIQSAEHGSLLIIPREGGFMVRMYLELDELDFHERAADRQVAPELLFNKARAILSPYTLDVKDLIWWSAYEIGQRLCPVFDSAGKENRSAMNPRIFIAGDACHTHSPKAGQGMNVAMADAFNLGWKLASVLRHQADPALLRSYSEERQAKAAELIEFDKEIARLISAKATDAAHAKKFQAYFKKHGRYTAGVETRYGKSVLVGDGQEHKGLAEGYAPGMRFHSAPVIRLSDAKPMHLGHVLKADGRWRVLLFAPVDDRAQTGMPVSGLCDTLANDENSPLRRYTPAGEDPDSVIDVRAIFQCHFRHMSMENLPSLLMPAKGRFGLIDYEKVFCADQSSSENQSSNDARVDIFKERGINRDKGAMVIVRPDQYVATVLPLTAFMELAAFFNGFMMDSSPGA